MEASLNVPTQLLTTPFFNANHTPTSIMPPRLAATNCVFRTSKHCHRSFSSTHQPRILDPLLTFTHDALQTLHTSTGLSWSTTLPLAAVIVRLSLLPLTLRVRNQTKRQLALSPLIKTRLSLLAADEHVRSVTLQQRGLAIDSSLKRSFSKRRQNVISDLWRKAGVKPWMPLATTLGVQFPIWLLVIETIRRMSGTSHGLLGFIAASINSLKESILGTKNLTEVVSSNGAIDTVESAQLIPLEPSFASEGTLWFSNLLLPDPEIYLPFMLSALMFTSISMSSSAKPFPALKSSGKGDDATIVSLEQPRKKKSSIMVNVLKLLALAIGPLTVMVPSGVLWYWVSSTAFNVLQTLVLDKIDPLEQPPRGFESEARLMSSKH
jgi:inner membrane protein COX18